MVMLVLGVPNHLLAFPILFACTSFACIGKRSILVLEYQAICSLSNFRSLASHLRLSLHAGPHIAPNPTHQIAYAFYVRLPFNT